MRCTQTACLAEEFFVCLTGSGSGQKTAGDLRKDRLRIVYVGHADGEEVDDHDVSCGDFLQNDEVGADAYQKTVSVFQDIGTQQLFNPHIPAHLCLQKAGETLYVSNINILGEVLTGHRALGQGNRCVSGGSVFVHGNLIQIWRHLCVGDRLQHV